MKVLGLTISLRSQEEMAGSGREAELYLNSCHSCWSLPLLRAGLDRMCRTGRWERLRTLAPHLTWVLLSGLLLL